MSKTPISPAQAGFPPAVISHTFVRLRGTQQADLTVFHAGTPSARVTLTWGGILMSFFNSETAQGALRAEIDLLAAAGARSPAAMYRVPDQAIAALDEDSRGAVIAIANSAQAIQPLQLHDGADKPAVLAALAAAAHHHQRRILALPATEQASAHATTNHYADTTTSPVTGRDNLEHGRWTLPLGSLGIVDDADHLNRDQLRYLTDNAARTNTKLLLLIARDPGREPAHSLTAVLTANLPWVQHLGTPDPAAQPPRTAVARAEHHLALTTTVSGEHTEVTHLLNRRKQLIDLYRDLTTDRDQTRDRDQRRARDYGLEL